MKIKRAAVAGQFYSSDKEQLSANIESYVVDTKKDCDYFSRAIIVPHAGHEYSGALAAKGYQYLKKDLETIFIFAPAHRHPVETFVVPTDDAWEIPLGEVYLHRQFTDEVKTLGGDFSDEAFFNEHSIEVQLPFIKQFMPEANIVPVLVGAANYHVISDIIAKYWSNEKVGFVISSDLSHFRNKPEAQRIDGATADMIENLISENMLPEQACGYASICGLMDFAKKKDFSLMRVGLTDSSEKTGDQTSVVGYGSWYLAEQNKCEFIKDQFSDTIKKLALVSIKSQLDKLNVKIERYPKAIESKMASFVTLEIGGNLRGCIGSIIGVEPLIVDICKNARNAAFNDPRFTPVEEKEFEKLDVSISILSHPSQIKFTDEDDLLNQLRPEIDGVIIKDVGRQAVYLPEVWKQVPDKKEFLNSLKQKAGLKPDWFSDTFEAYRFTTSQVK